MKTFTPPKMTTASKLARSFHTGTQDLLVSIGTLPDGQTGERWETRCWGTAQSLKAAAISQGFPVHISNRNRQIIG